MLLGVNWSPEKTRIPKGSRESLGVGGAEVRGIWQKKEKGAVDALKTNSGAEISVQPCCEMFKNTLSTFCVIRVKADRE